MTETPDDYFPLDWEIVIPSDDDPTVIKPTCGARVVGWWGSAVCDELYRHDGPHIGYTATHRVSWSRSIYTVLPR